MSKKLPSLTAPSSSVVIPFRQPEPRGFFKLRHAVLESTNWLSLTTDGISLFIEIAGRYRPNNNGEIAYSIEEAKQRFHIGYKKVSRNLDALEQHDFLIRTQHGRFDFSTQAERETKWSLTDWVLGSQLRSNMGVLGLAAEPNRLLDLRLDKEREEDSDFGLRQEEGQRSGLSRQTESESKNAPSDVKPSNPATDGCGVPRAAPAVWIEYEGEDSWKWDWVQRLGTLVTGKTYRQAKRSKGFPLPASEWEAIKNFATANPNIVKPFSANGGGKR